jgi:hypothetical protein
MLRRPGDRTDQDCGIRCSAKSNLTRQPLKAHMAGYIPEPQSRQIVAAVQATARLTPGVEVHDTSRADEWVIVRKDGIRGNLMLWTYPPGIRDGVSAPSRVTWECETFPDSWVLLNPYSPDEAARVVLEVHPHDLPRIRTDAQLRPPPAQPE